VKSALNPIVRSEDDREWQRYCGFLDLNVEQFMAIQETLLLQQLRRVGGSLLGHKLMGSSVSGSVDEFRGRVPLTSYPDYLPEIEAGHEYALPEKPALWAHTSGASATFKRVPYTSEFYHHALGNLMAAFILACSRRRGHSSLTEGDRVLFNVAPSPYLSGILAEGAARMFNLRSVMPPEEHHGLDFKDKVARGFECSLRTGVDILVAMTSVLVKMGEDFGRLTGHSGSTQLVSHPAVLSRYTRAFLQSRLEQRDILPRDLWPVKAIIGWGIDTSVYQEQVYRYWGAYPYEMHACTEAGVVALQSWNRKGLTLLPHSNFYEFIAETDWLRSRRDLFYLPRTVLLSEVRPGERYELVITSFYGMPFLRYRLGHLIEITSLQDEEVQIFLPQMAFEARADDLIDIAGFTRISEKTVSRAVAGAGLACQDWVARKEVSLDRTALHLFIELGTDCSEDDIASALHKELVRLDPGYRDLERMMGICPMEVTLLRRGTFGEYYAEQLGNGAALAEQKPPRMNCPGDTVDKLLRISNAGGVLAV